MNSNKTLILFLLIICVSKVNLTDSFYSQLKHKPPEDLLEQDIRQFLFHLLEFGTELFSNEEMNAISYCLDQLGNRQVFQSAFKASGKEFGDPGFESNCLKENNLTYYLLLYSVSKEAFDNQNDWEIISFLRRQNNFLTGMCVIDGCLNVIPILQTSKNFHAFLKEIGISDLRISTTNVLPVERTGSYLSYQILLWTLIGLFCLMIVSFVFSHVLRIEAKSQRDKDQLNTSFLQQEDEKNEDNHTKENSFSSSNLVSSDCKKLSSTTTFEDERLTKSFVLNLLNYFSLTQNLSYLFQPSNTWFNESSLEFIAVLRFIFLCFITYNHTFYAFIKMIQEDFFNMNVYTSVLFGIVKVTLYGVDFSLVLDSFIMSYKLMWYLKKNCYDKDNEVSFKVLASFCLLLIPKLVTFIIEYYLIILFSPNLACDLNTTPYRLFIHDTTSIGKKECEKQPWRIFIPFYLQYIDYLSYDKKSVSYATCFRYSLIYQNELICFVVFIALIYLMNKLGSKLFDYLIGFFVFLGLCLTVIDFEFIANKPTMFDFHFFLGQTFTLKYTHMFFNIYMLGAFAGIIYFYHKDSISSKPITFQPYQYYPFDFCFKIMKRIDSLSVISCYVISFLWWIMLLLFSLTFYFYRQWYTRNQKGDFTQLIVQVNWLMRFLYYYDRHIIVFFFLAYLLIQFMKSKHVFINYLGAFNLMIVVSRVSFSSFLCSDSIIYLFLIGYDFDSVMDYSDCFVLTVGIFFLNILICAFLTILIEIPMRVLVKILIRFIVFKDNNSSDLNKLWNISSLTPIL